MASVSYTKIMSRSFASLLCTLSLWSTPAKVEASCCEDDCCDGGWWSGGAGRTALIIGGAAVVGGIAGAIAGNASSGHSHHGRRGPTGATGATGAVGPAGPAGPSVFVTDVGQSLTFSYGLTAAAILLGDAVVIPFVERPDGIVVEGPPVTISILGIPTIAPITIVDPVFGTYHAGLQITSGGLATVGLSLTIAVGASRDGSLTNVGTDGIDPTALFSIGATEAQTTTEFTYGPANIP
ncbi:hypothetical protein PNK_2274 [Candidatus Protochlamydia naegleriophila]|uniref:Uncharacterized protein n=1 Tax=Candidatus Protochlamydia naegleriophila TaxID=389348 RepID=A0A0U5EUE5_9BACT|nr:hypothetical protein [Candidatus Protochlamydia naegleriophila]CUI17872.1 hypothetical protein PNK_2274 [Candidatus Protochlamydia naegleriophila]